MAANEYTLFLRRFVEQVWERENLAAIGQYIAAGCVYHDSALASDFRGPAELGRYIQVFRAAVRNWHFQVEDVVKGGDTIAVRWIVEGIHDGSLPQLPPPGTPVRLTGITIYQLRGSKVAEAWSCWNAKGVQLMRTVFCACGLQLEAPDDAELFQQYRAHIDDTHPEWGYSDEKIRSVILGCAHDRRETAEELDEQEYGG